MKKRRNRGSATVEACLVVPLFLFFMLAAAGMDMLLVAEAHIHQSLAEAANETAQYSYLKSRVAERGGGTDGGAVVDTVLLNTAFRSYLGEDAYVEKAVKGGKNGILLRVLQDTEDPAVFTARADYLAGVQSPLMEWAFLKLSCRVRKRAFVGYESGIKRETYVYVTPNQEVYHLKRGCTYLVLSVEELDSARKNAYSPCGFCGREQPSNGKIYVAKTGEVYHCRRDCIGLKRTVTRKKLSEVQGLPPCSRCGRRVP